jgi:tetratricopeptide (TPR) repeat protein
MERSRSHILEEESRRAFVNSLPPAWTWEKKDPDYGLDMEVVIFENGKKTNKVLWFQLKGTESVKRSNGIIPFSIETKYLKHFEGCHLPVIILLWIKPENSFHYLFAQRYIREQLSVENPGWRSQKTVTIKFASQSKLEKAETLDSIATEGYLYVIQQELYEKAQGRTTYWLDGIPKSDDKELKELMIKALEYMRDEKYNDAIEELEDILRTCTVSPTERMSILLNLGIAYYSVGQSQNALKNYRAILKLAPRVKEEEALFGVSATLVNIGLVYWARGELDNALRHYQDALKIDREVGYRQGEAADLCNIGLIYKDRGDLGNALQYHQDALKIHREVGYRQGEATDLCNIGLVYGAKGDLVNALKCLEDALRILDASGLAYGRDMILRAINSIKNA